MEWFDLVCLWIAKWWHRFEDEPPEMTRGARAPP